MTWLIIFKAEEIIGVHPSLFHLWSQADISMFFSMGLMEEIFFPDIKSQTLYN